MSVNQEAEPIRVDQSKILSNDDAWKKQEAKDKQNSATRRERIKSFVEGNGLHPKAFAQFRAIRKIEDENKRGHAIRTIEALLPILKEELHGAELPLNEPGDNVVKMQDAAKSADQEMDEIEKEEAEFNAAADDIDLAQPTGDNTDVTAAE